MGRMVAPLRFFIALRYTLNIFMLKLHRRFGFSLIEALIVIVVVGILATVAIYSLNITRAGSRDAKRVSDISVMRAAMSQYWLQKATYPISTPVDLGKVGAGADALAGSGFVGADQQPVPPIFIDQVPVGPKLNEYYRYHGSADGYSLRFTTERPTAYGPAGTWYAHANGVDTVDTEN